MVWLAEGNTVLKISADDGQILRTVPAAEPVREIAVDEAASRIWFYSGSTLRATTTNGSPLFEVGITALDDSRVAMDVNSVNQSVWLALGAQLWNYSPTGVQLAAAAVRSSVLALETDTANQILWTATEQHGTELLDPATGSTVDWWFSFPLEGPPTLDLSRSPQTGLLYTLENGYVQSWSPDPSMGLIAVAFITSAPDAHLLAARSDGTYFASSSTLSRVSDAGAILWSIQPFPTGEIVDLESDPADGSVWVAGSQQVAKVSDSGALLQLFDFPTLTLIQDLEVAVELVVDETPPQITVVSPIPDSAVAFGTPIIQGVFVDDESGVELSTVLVRLDGVDRTADSQTIGTIVTLLPDVPLADGEHEVSISISDHAGNIGSASWSFIVDSVAPEIAFIAPDADLIIAVEPPDAVLTFNDAGIAGIDPASLRVRAGELLVPCVTSAGTATCNTIGLRSGHHLFQAEIADLAGNTAVTETQVEFRLDVLPPSLTIESPEVGTVTHSPVVDVAGTVSDDGAVEAVVVNAELALLTGSAFSAQVPLTEGRNELRLTAADTTGKITGSTRSVILDTIAPELTLELPLPGAFTNHPDIQFQGRAQDPNLVAVEVAGASIALIDGSFDLRVPVTLGANQLIVEATDAAGNRTSIDRTVTRISLPEIEITEPPDLEHLAVPTIDVLGTCDESAEAVLLNGVNAQLSGGTFLAHDVPLIEGGNILTATVTDGLGQTATDTILVVRDLSPPRLHIEFPRDRARIGAPTIAVFGMVNDIVAGTVNATEVEVVVNGITAEVLNRSFLARSVPLTLGENQISITAQDSGGNTSVEQITVFRSESDTRRLMITSGNLQIGTIGSELPQQLEVTAIDATGSPVAGVPVLFSVRRGDGIMNAQLRQARVVTGVDGKAAVTFRLGRRAGVSTQWVDAFASGFGTVTFVASALPAAPSHIFVDAGNFQIGVADRHLPRPLTAVVTDEGFNRLADVPVRFQVVKGTGHFDNDAPQVDVATDTDGRAIVAFVLGTEEGISNNVIEAHFLPSGESSVTFVASALAAGIPNHTSISGVVLDNSNLPVPGVTLRILGTNVHAQSDDFGYFRIAPAPIGTLKLIVDGSTATRPGAWPDLEFVLTTVPGRDNTLGMPIFLLPLDLQQSLHVTEATGGILTLAEVPGFALEIAPGSVTFPGGSKSGLISVSVVHADKVPMVPNFGQQPRLIVTIQPAGARFDPPARLTLPNVDGLAPGQVTEMYSFDHDLGHFVSIGPATVSEDGEVVVSNPEVGILKAGWHCGGDPAQTGITHACPFCHVCDGSQCIPGCAIASESVQPAEISSVSAAACLCSDSDTCTVNDRCQGGRCQGDPVRILKVTALPNGLEETVVGLAQPVAFAASVEHENCDDFEYFWDFGDGGVSTEPAPTHTYGFPGEFKVNLRVTCHDCPQASGTDDAIVKVIFVDVQFADVTQDRIEILLAPPTVTGILTLQLRDPATHTIRSQSRAGVSHTDSFDIPNLAPGEYSRLKATWEVDGFSVEDDLAYHIEVLGAYRHSQYNTPHEANCTGAHQAAYITTGGQTTSQCFNNPNAFYTTTLPSGFISQVNLNGSGTTSAFGFVQADVFCPGTQAAPPNSANRTFRQANLNTACNNTNLNDKTVAACLGSKIACGDRVFIHSVGLKTVTDNCPACCGAAGAAQLDNFTTVPACSGITDLGNFMTIKVFP